jgi:hypothetical protein
LGVIKNTITAELIEKLNSEYTMNFEAILDQKLNSFINDTSMFEVDDDYFDMAMLDKVSNDDGTYTVSAETEHISYRLNDEDYNVESFDQRGTPTDILNSILAGTGFKAGTVEFSASTRYVTGAVSRRELLMQFATKMGGELVFKKFQISLVKHRGSTQRRPFVKGLNVRILSQHIDKRNRKANGDFEVSYTSEPISLGRGDFFLGDDVKLMDRNLSMFEDLRIVSITYDPTSDVNLRLEFAKEPSQWYGSGIENNVSGSYPEVEYNPDEDPDPYPGYDDGTGTGGGGDSSLFRVVNGVPQWYNEADQSWNEFAVGGTGTVVIERWI